MHNHSEKDLFPIAGWQAPPTYFISIGGLGYITLSWLMYYISQYLPEGQGMDQFTGARFIPVDTAAPDRYDLPPTDWASSRLFNMHGDLNAIIDEVQTGNYPGIKEFYEDTSVAQEARKVVGDLGAGAGTTRPFGRIGFFYNWERLHSQLEKELKFSFHDCPMRFEKHFQLLQGNKRQFVIISSLAGGTGSSCFFDIAATLQILRRHSYPNETWTVIGMFTLADVLASDKKVYQEKHRTRMKANSYAALKELNHFMSGQPFQARYGRDGSHTITLTNREERNKLFDLVFLADTPNQDNLPLGGRMEVARFLGQSLLHLCLTSFNAEFFNRLVDSTANLLFCQEYPPGNQTGEERQQFLFSTLGLSNLELPVTRYNEYACYCLSEQIIDHLYERSATSSDRSTSEQIASSFGLTEDSLNRYFQACSVPVIQDTETCFWTVREAEDPMQELRRLAVQLESIPADTVRNQAGRIRDDIINKLFPPGNRGPLQNDLDRLASSRGLSTACDVLDDLIEMFTNQNFRIQADLETARAQVRAGEAPGFLGESDERKTILEQQEMADLLNAMEQSFNAWGNRFFRGLYRRRFAEQFEGEIANILESFQRFQSTAFKMLIWPVKIELLDIIIKKLEQHKAAFEARGQFVDRLKSDIFKTKKMIKKNTEPIFRFQVSALTADHYFETIFKPNMGDIDAFVQQADDVIRTTGLRVSPTQTIRFSDWSDQPVDTITQALFTFCFQNSVGKVRDRFTQVGLDHDLFLPGKDPSHFDYTLQDWKYKSQVSLLFKGTLPEINRCVISGTRVTGPDSWDDTLNLHGMRVLKGGTSNNATLINLALGFPVQNMARIKDWYEMAYIPQKRQGWPLHLFLSDDEDLMVEPYLDWIDLPARPDAEELFQEALACRVITESNNKIFLEAVIRESLPARLKTFFYDQTHEPKQFEKNEFHSMLLDDKRLSGALLHALLRTDPPAGIDEDAWEEEKNQLMENQKSIEDILDMAARAGLLHESAGRLCFDQALCTDSLGKRDNFNHAFFTFYESGKSIDRETFINGLMTHKPLCRWMTKKILRCLLHPQKKQETRNRLAENGFHHFLDEVIRRYLG